MDSNKDAVVKLLTLVGTASCRETSDAKGWMPKRAKMWGAAAWTKPATATQPIAIVATGPQNACSISSKTAITENESFVTFWCSKTEIVFHSERVQMENFDILSCCEWLLIQQMIHLRVPSLSTSLWTIFNKSLNRLRGSWNCKSRCTYNYCFSKWWLVCFLWLYFKGLGEKRCIDDNHNHNYNTRCGWE